MVRSALAKQQLPLIQLLLIEDNPSDAFLVESLFEGDKTAHYKTYCVKTHAAAIEALAQQDFDVCLLDLTLPDATGFSAMVDIQEKAPDMPVLILTGTNDMELAKTAVGCGAQDYLLKDEIEVVGLVRAIDYAVERKRVEKELIQRANYDALTGLFNRESLVSRINLALARAERSHASVVILFIDIDGFKLINDQHGHDAGDAALKIIAQRIKHVLHTYDTPARFGGDEFVVLLEGIKNPRDAANIAQKIVNELSMPIPYNNHQLEIGASVGISFSDAPISADLLIQYADIAMYHAKKKGGNAYRFYAETMHNETKYRLTLEEDLRTALEVNELRLHYQPYLNIDSNEVIGVEALLRWQHPERGILNAKEFLSAAESAKLMPMIGKWKCDQLRHDIAMWNASELPPLNIAVNLSTSQLDASNLVECFAPITSADFLGLHRLMAEIPEAAITPISGARFMAIAKLHELGIGLHLDHFGCCSLPLMTLNSLPFSMLKIDISLIQNMGKDLSEDLLINAAIMLAHHLGLKVGAVGVEEPWQAAMLKSQSCDIIQGYLATKPMTAEELVGWLKER